MAKTPSTSGYNDGLHEGSGGMTPATGFDVSAIFASATTDAKSLAAPDAVTESAFDATMEKGMVGKDLLQEGLARHESRLEDLRPTWGKMTAGSGA